MSLKAVHKIISLPMNIICHHSKFTNIRQISQKIKTVEVHILHHAEFTLSLFLLYNCWEETKIKSIKFIGSRDTNMKNRPKTRLPNDKNYLDQTLPSCGHIM